MTKAEDLELCLKSLVEQDLLPAEIVLIRDGPVTPDVESCIQKFGDRLPFLHVYFAKNRGLGDALRDGLNKCTHDLVARVDSDDRSLTHRFETQVNYLEQEISVSVVGGWLREYYDQGRSGNLAIRKTPLDYRSLRRLAKWRNPINHPTVMFRKSHVLACGSFESCHFFEDYFLWAKMLQQGFILRNIPQVLVETNIDDSYFLRRGGFPYVKYEFLFIKKLVGIGFLTPKRALIFFVTRLPIKLLPGYIRKSLYKLVLRTKNGGE